MAGGRVRAWGIFLEPIRTRMRAKYEQNASRINLFAVKTREFRTYRQGYGVGGAPGGCLVLSTRTTRWHAVPNPVVSSTLLSATGYEQLP